MSRTVVGSLIIAFPTSRIIGFQDNKKKEKLRTGLGMNCPWLRPDQLVQPVVSAAFNEWVVLI